jgi:NitT/TauT family transport system permease protein
MIWRTFGLPLSRRPLNWADGVVLLALVGLLATLAWLGHAMWAPFSPDAPPALELDPWRLPAYAARSLLRMFAALGASLVFTPIARPRESTQRGLASSALGPAASKME